MPSFAIIGIVVLGAVYLMARQPTGTGVAGQSSAIRGRAIGTQAGATNNALGGIAATLNSLFGQKASSGAPSMQKGSSGGASSGGAPGAGGFTQSGHQSPSNQNVDTSNVTTLANGPSKIPGTTGVQPDGSTVLPDGTVINPDGSTMLPDGTILDASGNPVETAIIQQSAPGDASILSNIVSTTNIAPQLAPQASTDSVVTAQDQSLGLDLGIVPFVDATSVDQSFADAGFGE